MTRSTELLGRQPGDRIDGAVRGIHELRAQVAATAAGAYLAGRSLSDAVAVFDHRRIIAPHASAGAARRGPPPGVSPPATRMTTLYGPDGDEPALLPAVHGRPVRVEIERVVTPEFEA